jgi:SLT domain-containing protein
MAPGHAYVAEAAFLFDVIGFQKGTRVREQSFFQTAEKDQREFQTFGSMQRHQRDLGAFVVGVGIGYQSGMI